MNKSKSPNSSGDFISATKKYRASQITALAVACIFMSSCDTGAVPIRGNNEAIVCDGPWDIYEPIDGELPFVAATKDGGIIDKMGASDSGLQGAVVETLLQVGNNENLRHFPTECTVQSDLTRNEIDTSYSQEQDLGNVAITVLLPTDDRRVLLVAPHVTAPDRVTVQD